MLVKLQAILAQMKTNAINTWTAISPYATWIGNALITLLGLLAKLSNQLSLIIGIAIGYKLEPVLKIIGPLLKLVLNIALIPLKILGWL